MVDEKFDKHVGASHGFCSAENVEHLYREPWRKKIPAFAIVSLLSTF